MGGISQYGGDFIFSFALPICAIGSMMFSILSMIGLEFTNVLANKTASVIINVVIGLSGLITFTYWFNFDIPFLSAILRDTITTVGKENAPKPRLQ